MSEQSTESPAQPTLCKMGCGFFGSNATGQYCSKCWALLKNKDNANNPTEKSTTCSKVIEPSSASQELNVTESATPMEVDTGEIAQPPAKTTPSAPKKKSKKKKKTSYKAMMSSMLQGSGETRDIEKEKQALRKVTGGGAFAKIDKI